MKNYLAVDVGGTAIKYALMTEGAEILEKGEVPTPRDCLESFMDALYSVYAPYNGQVEALVMSAPGRIDANKGYFYTSGALGYLNDKNLPELMKDRIPVPITVENDAKAAALAELWQGSMIGIETGSVIVLGTGIGGAVIVNGKLHRGYTFAAGEYSNLSMNWRDPIAKGNAWSDDASTTGLVRQYAAAIGVDRSEVDGRKFFAAANAGDEKALAVLDQFAFYVASGIWSLQVALDCERYAIGGGISKQPLLLECINKNLTKLFEEKGTCPMSQPEVVVCKFGNDANLIGALYHYLYELKLA